MKKNILLTFCLWAVAIGLHTSCKQGIEEGEQIPTQTSPSTAPKEANAPNRVQVLSTENKRKIVSFELEPQEIIVRFEGNVLIGQLSKKDKNRYSNQKGDIVGEVKYKDNSFKLRTADGKLLWKVKYLGDKVKIYAQEDHERNPIEIKKQDNGHLKVTLKNSELGKVKLKGEKIIIESNMSSMYAIHPNTNSFAWGVLTIKDIPTMQRYIIFAELLANGL